MTHPRTAIVIGAGISGLATATLLARAGMRVRVFEQQQTYGGRAGQLELSGFRWDMGPSWYLMPEAYDQFFRLCGTTTADVYELVDLAPAYRVFSPTQPPLDVHTGVEQASALFESLEPGAGSRLEAYLARATFTYTMALRHFLYTTFRRPQAFLHRDIVRHLGLLLRLLCQSLERLVNKEFEHPRLRQLLQYPAVFLSTEPSAAPALYSLMSHTDLVDGVRYPRGGFRAVVDAIYEQACAAGVEFHFGVGAERILTDVQGTGTQGVGVQVVGVQVAETEANLSNQTEAGPLLDEQYQQPHSTDHASEKFHAADVVVSTADVVHTRTALLGEEAPKLRRVPRNPGVGTVLVFAGVRGALPELAHHNLLLSDDWDPDFAAVFPATANHSEAASGAASESIYVSKTTATDEDAAPEGHENLFILIPVAADEELGHGDVHHAQADAKVTAIAQAAIEQIAQWAGVPDLPERIVVQRTLGPADFAEQFNAWRGGAIGPAHTLFQSAFFRGTQIDPKISGLFYAGGSTVPGVGVPMCLISAENVVKAIADDTSTTALEALPQL